MLDGSETDGRNVRDIDIDVSDRAALLARLPHVRASRLAGRVLRPHPSGIHPVDVPVDPVSGLCSLPREHPYAGRYPRVDVFGSSVLAGLRSRREVADLLERPVDWEAFRDPRTVSRLPQIGNRAERVARLGPRSVAELAAVLALLRPAAAPLRDLPRREALARAFDAPGGGYAFKRSHAFGYALLVLVALARLMAGTAHAPATGDEGGLDRTPGDDARRRCGEGHGRLAERRE